MLEEKDLGGTGLVGEIGLSFGSLATAEGRLVIVGVPQQPLQMSAADLIPASRLAAGHASGTAKDSEDTLRFAAMTGVRPMVETMSLLEADQAFERMMSGKARFRVVLTV